MGAERRQPLPITGCLCIWNAPVVVQKAFMGSDQRLADRSAGWLVLVDQARNGRAAPDPVGRGRDHVWVVARGELIAALVGSVVVEVGGEVGEHLLSVAAIK